MSEFEKKRREPAHHEIALKAYRLWELRVWVRMASGAGYSDAIGQEMADENWFHAERLLGEERRPLLEERRPQLEERRPRLEERRLLREERHDQRSDESGAVCERKG